MHILNATSLTPSMLEPIARRTEEIFCTAAEIERFHVALSIAYDASRGQYHSSALLQEILKSRFLQTGSTAILIVDVDLFIPILTFVFGEAQLGGPAAVVSTFRLQNQFYGLPPNPPLFLQRLEKEIIHELGHVFGLYHCRQFECVMRSSTYAEEIDLKQTIPCRECIARLRLMEKNARKDG